MVILDFESYPTKRVPAHLTRILAPYLWVTHQLRAYIWEMGNTKSGGWDKAPVPCSQCGRHYRADLIKQCPGCAATNQSTEISTPPVSNWSGGSTSTSATLDDLIRAQNRTTHAVRAFVRFLFIQLTGLTFAVILWNISLTFIDQQKCLDYGDYCDGNPFFQFLAGAVWIGTVVLSSWAGWEELNKSEIK